MTAAGVVSWRIMPLESPANLGPESISVATTSGQATFTRLGAGHAKLEIEHHTPAYQAELAQRSLEKGLQDICQQEIASMRQTFGELSRQLEAKLPGEGTTPGIERTWKNQEQRTWCDNGPVFAVDPTRTRMSDRMQNPAGVSEAKLVQAYVGLMIEQREENIRDIYQKVLAEAQAKRRTSGPMELENQRRRNPMEADGQQGAE